MDVGVLADLNRLSIWPDGVPPVTSTAVAYRKPAKSPPRSNSFVPSASGQVVETSTYGQIEIEPIEPGDGIARYVKAVRRRSEAGIVDLN